MPWPSEWNIDCLFGHSWETKKEQNNPEVCTDYVCRECYEPKRKIQEGKFWRYFWLKLTRKLK